VSPPPGLAYYTIAYPGLPPWARLVRLYEALSNEPVRELRPPQFILGNKVRALEVMLLIVQGHHI
ncbi:MAG: hypothetical protein ACXVJ8_16830, partial [Candidatus Angelobacter sp.]